MSHDNHNDHHHVDDLSGFSLLRVVWPAALLIMLIFVTRNCCGSSNCCKKEKTCCSKEQSCEKNKSCGKDKCEEGKKCEAGEKAHH